MNRNEATGTSTIHVVTQNYYYGLTTVDIELSAVDTARFLFNHNHFITKFAQTYNPRIAEMCPGRGINTWDSSLDDAAMARVTALVYAAQLANKQVHRDVLSSIPQGPSYAGANPNKKKLIIFALFALFIPKRYRSEIFTRAGGRQEEIHNFTFNALWHEVNNIMKGIEGRPLPVVFRG